MAHLGEKRDARKLQPRAELINNLPRDSQEKIQSAAHCLVATQRRVKRDKAAWEIGSLHDCRKTFITRTTDIVPRHVLQKYIGQAHAGDDEVRRTFDDVLELAGRQVRDKQVQRALWSSTRSQGALRSPPDRRSLLVR